MFVSEHTAFLDLYELSTTASPTRAELYQPIRTSLGGAVQWHAMSKVKLCDLQDNVNRAQVASGW